MAATLAAALIIKITVAVQLADHPLLQPAGTLDTAYYVEAAKRVAGGDLLLGSRAFYASPLYTYFLALIFALAGPSLLVARVVQAVTGAIGLGLAMATARQLYGRNTALISGLLLALTGTVTFFEVVILQSALDPALMALDGWLAVRAARKGTPWAWALAGAGLGLHALNRPNMLVCAAACMVYAAYRAWRQHRDLSAAGRIAASVALGTMLAIAPATLRNLAVSGEPILITSHGGLNFYIGNNAKSDGAYHSVDGITPSIEGQATDAQRLVSAALGHAASDADVSAYFTHKAWQWIGDNPVAAIRLTGRKLLFLLNATSPSLNYSYSYFSHEEATLLKVLLVGPWLLIPLGIAGFVISLRKNVAPGLAILAIVTVAYAVSVIVFFVTDRYQLPLLMPLAVAGGGALSYMWEQRRAARTLALPLATFAVAAVATNINLGLDVAKSEERVRMSLTLIEHGDASRGEALLAQAENTHRNPALLHYQAGHAYAKRREFGPAAAHLKRALELRPGMAEAELMLGQVQVEAGYAGEAIEHLRRAAEKPEMRDQASLELVKALAANGQFEDASRLLRQLTPPAGTQPDTLIALGALSLKLRQPADAIRFFEAALRLKPRDTAVIEQLAVARSLAGDLNGAASTLEKAIQLEPGSASLHLNLAVTYAMTGRMNDARREVQEALRLRPDYPQARGLLERLNQSQ